MHTTAQDTQTWPELAIGLYDKLTGRGAEITLAPFELRPFMLGWAYMQRSRQRLEAAC